MVSWSTKCSKINVCRSKFLLANAWGLNSSQGPDQYQGDCLPPLSRAWKYMDTQRKGDHRFRQVHRSKGRPAADPIYWCDDPLQAYPLLPAMKWKHSGGLPVETKSASAIGPHPCAHESDAKLLQPQNWYCNHLHYTSKSPHQLLLQLRRLEVGKCLEWLFEFDCPDSCETATPHQQKPHKVVRLFLYLVSEFQFHQ